MEKFKTGFINCAVKVYLPQYWGDSKCARFDVGVSEKSGNWEWIDSLYFLFDFEPCQNEICALLTTT